MKTLSLIMLVLSFTFTTPVMAVDKNGKYSVQGSRSCGEWAKARKANDLNEVVIKNWIAGHINAYNSVTPDVYDIMGGIDLESVCLWMDKYCQENPLSKLPEGMNTLTKELWPNRVRTKDD